MKPPPPIPHEKGLATPAQNVVAIAASIALPPLMKTTKNVNWTLIQRFRTSDGRQNNVVCLLSNNNNYNNNMMTMTMTMMMMIYKQYKTR